MATNGKKLRQKPEEQFAAELQALQQESGEQKPENWALSPAAVVKYILGGTAADGTEIRPKYIGQRRRIEVAVATLLTDRALLLVGVPGTGKTWLSEHLAAAVSGDSTLIVQGTAGLGEEAIRYGWNYAELIAKGPSEKALVPSPVMRGMQEGKLVRVEELTRMPSDVQDNLITILSEKILPIPELDELIPASPGFNVIATANDRDKGVNELSSALRRRFNRVQLPLPETFEEEVKIVQERVSALMPAIPQPNVPTALEEVERLVTIFRELREGTTLDGKRKLNKPRSTLSTAEIISVMQNGLALSGWFGDGTLRPTDLAPTLEGAIVKDSTTDEGPWQEYIETVMKERKDWKSYYEALTQSNADGA